MNGQEIFSLLRTLLSVVGGILVTNHLATAPDVVQATTDIMTIAPALVSLVSIGAGIYSHWNMKKVPETSVALAQSAVTGNPVKGATVAVRSPINQVVGAMLLALCLGNADPARAAPAASGPCNLTTLFVGMTAQNFMSRLGDCGAVDFQSALDDANTAPVDNMALACLIPATALVKAVSGVNSGTSGLATAFQKFRRAKQSGIVGSCTAYVNSTVMLQ